MSRSRKRQKGLFLILGVKQLAFRNDCPGNQDQFASTSTQSHLRRFATLAETTIEATNNRIRADRSDGGYIEVWVRKSLSALDSSVRAPTDNRGEDLWGLKSRSVADSSVRQLFDSHGVGLWGAKTPSGLVFSVKHPVDSPVVTSRRKNLDLHRRELTNHRF